MKWKIQTFHLRDKTALHLHERESGWFCPRGCSHSHQIMGDRPKEIKYGNAPKNFELHLGFLTPSPKTEMQMDVQRGCAVSHVAGGI